MLDLDFNSKAFPDHNARFQNVIYKVTSSVSGRTASEVRTQILKAKGFNVLGAGHFATVIQYPYRNDKVVRIASTLTLGGEQDKYEDYVRYLRRSRANNPCFPEIYSAKTSNDLTFIVMDKYRKLSAAQQDHAAKVFAGEVPAVLESEKELRAAAGLFKRSSLSVPDVRGDNIMMHQLTYKIVDPLGGEFPKEEPKIKVQSSDFAIFDNGLDMNTLTISSVSVPIVHVVASYMFTAITQGAEGLCLLTGESSRYDLADDISRYVRGRIPSEHLSSFRIYYHDRTNQFALVKPAGLRGTIEL